MCATGNPNFCIKCYDCEAYKINGQCMCPDGGSFSTDTLTCVQDTPVAKIRTTGCNVIGCQTCVEGNPNFC